MPGWALRLGAFLTTLVVFVGSLDYTLGHVKNVAAPLHPPVDAAAAVGTPATPAPKAGPSDSPLPQLVPNRGKPRPTTSPGPLITLQPGVHATALPQVSITHVS